MNRLIHYGSVASIPYYNCSWRSSEEWFTTGVRRPWLRVPIAILGIVFEALYIPIIYIIFKTKLIRHACYKIILLLTVIDINATVGSCIISGILYSQGAVFCSYPTFLYIAGGVALSTWCGACACTVSLFLNRIVSIIFQSYADYIEKRMAYTSMVLSVCYVFYIDVFTPPALLNSAFMAWLPDPLSEPIPSEEAASWYRNTSQSWNNWIFVTSMFILFTIYCALVNKLALGQKSKASRAIFIQCCIICFFNTCTALFYNALSIVTPAPWILILGQWCWSINHGIPAVIYVTMNDTIRREFKRLLLKSHRVEDKQSSNTVHNSTKSRI